MKKTKLTALAQRSQTLPMHVVKDRVVQGLMEAEKALSVAVGIDQVKLVMNVAAAQEVFAKRQKLGEVVIGFAHALKFHALAKLGDLLAVMPKATGTRGQLKGATKGLAPGGTRKVLPGVSAVPTLADVFGMPPHKAPEARKLAALAQQLAGLDAKTREAIAQREDTLAQTRRRQKGDEIRRVVSLPDAKYRVLYADPPWSYNDKADAGSVQIPHPVRSSPYLLSRSL